MNITPHDDRVRGEGVPAAVAPTSPSCDPHALAIERWRTSCEPRTRISAFEVSSKRRKGYPSETHVKRGLRFVHGDKELVEKLGRNDPCPCGSGRCFQEVLHALRPLRRVPPRPLLSAD